MVRIPVMASVVVTVMTLVTVLIGPGIGVEANTVTMQTCGKTLMMTLRDIVQSARFYAAAFGLPVA